MPQVWPSPSAKGPDAVAVLREAWKSHVWRRRASGWRWSVRPDSGKSTLLHLLGGLDVPSAGEVKPLGWDFSTISDARAGRRATNRWASSTSFTIYAGRVLGLRPSPCRSLRRMAWTGLVRAAETLTAVGLGHQDHTPENFPAASTPGGHRGRWSQTRPASGRRAPTGNLDRQTAEGVCADAEPPRSRTSLSSSPTIPTAAQASRVLQLQDGVLGTD